MRFNPRALLTRLALLVLGDRLVVAVIDRNRTEVFTIDAEQPAAALRAELDSRKIDAGSVAIGLPRASVTVKPIDLPAVAGEIEEMVKFELERHLPFPADDAAFAFIPLPADGDSKSAAPAKRVLVTAADRRVIDSALRIAEEANLRPVSLTVAPHDLLGLTEVNPRARIVWVHRTGDGADVLFLAGSTLAFSRALPGAEPSLIADEIRQSFAVVRWSGCDALWISGDVEMPSVVTAPALASLGAPVVVAPYTARAARRLNGLEPTQRGVPELAVAVALAGRPRVLDLLPPGLRPWHLTRDQKVTVGALAAAIVLGLGALWVPGYRDTRRITAINAEIRRLEPPVREVERLQQERDRKKRLLATIESLQTSAPPPLPVLQELTEVLPNDAWLTALTSDAKGVELTGQAALASGLIPLLENSSLLERVEFSSPVTRGRDREQFRIRAAWKAQAVNAAARTEPPTARTAPSGPTRSGNAPVTGSSPTPALDPVVSPRPEPTPAPPDTSSGSRRAPGPLPVPEGNR